MAWLTGQRAYRIHLSLHPSTGVQTHATGPIFYIGAGNPDLGVKRTHYPLRHHHLSVPPPRFINVKFNFSCFIIDQKKVISKQRHKSSFGIQVPRGKLSLDIAQDPIIKPTTTPYSLAPTLCTLNKHTQEHNWNVYICHPLFPPPSPPQTDWADSEAAMLCSEELVPEQQPFTNINTEAALAHDS